MVTLPLKNPCPLQTLGIVHYCLLPGEVSRTCYAHWTSDQTHVILEVSEGDKKATSDSERCSWRELLHELEDSGMTDATVNSHDVKHATSSGEGLLFLFNKQQSTNRIVGKQLVWSAIVGYYLECRDFIRW